MNRLIPDSIATRTLVVLVVGLTLSHVLSMLLYVTDRTSALMLTGGEHIAERIAVITRFVENSSDIERQRLVRLADSPELRVALSPESQVEDQEGGDWRARAFREALLNHQKLADAGALHFRYLEESDSGSGPAFLAAIRLGDRAWLNVSGSLDPQNPFWSFRFGLSMIVMLVAVVLLSALVVHRFTKSFSAFARAAQRLGVDVKAPPLPETGPAEVRQVARAFNDMQARIRRFVEDRTQMIAAISHDLGTPITRLRLRAEFIEDEEQRRKMLADLDDMERMIFSALAFARNEALTEPPDRIDLRALLRRLCDDAVDAGHTVELETGESAVPYSCQPVALRRALSNLVDNAVKYGRQARVSLRDDPSRISIQIDDDGPGIPEEYVDEVFKPFRRLEASRSRETGGTGLGLTVARTIIRAHGGDLTLANRPDGGLRVEVNLPR